MTKRIKAWWFSDGYTLPYGDGRKIKLGKTHTVRGRLAICRNGLHASINPLDALKYAPGPVIWRVELAGNIIKSVDKLCASKRTYIAGGVDVSEEFRKFARRCALDVVDNWDCPGIVKRYLESGDESIQIAAYYSAWHVASGSSPGSSADSAAWSAFYATNVISSQAYSAASFAAASAGHYTDYYAYLATLSRKLSKVLESAIGQEQAAIEEVGVKNSYFL